MKLKDFVSETLVSLGEAVAESSDALRRQGVEAGGDEAGRVRIVRFDLAVAARPADEAGGRPSIEVVAAPGAGSSQAQQVSRIRFSIPLALDRAPGGEPEIPRPTDLEWE